MKILDKISISLQNIFSLDLRSIAIFRISLGILMLFDSLSRYRDAYAHLTDYGILPRSVLNTDLSNVYSFSLSNISGELLFQQLLLIFTILMSVFLIFGYRVKLTSFILWILTLSFQNRNPQILHASDQLLRQMLFMAIFLPTGYYFSLDSKRPKYKTNDYRNKNYFGLITVLAYLQIVFLYLFAGLYKTSNDWSINGNAIYYMLSAQQFSIGISNFLLNLKQLYPIYSIAGFFVHKLELFGTLLFFIPFKNKLFKTIAILSFLIFHLFILITMNIAPFAIADIVFLILFVPTNVIEFIKNLKLKYIKKINKTKKPQKVEFISVSSQYFNIYKFLINVFVLNKDNFKILNSKINGIEVKTDKGVYKNREVINVLISNKLLIKLINLLINTVTRFRIIKSLVIKLLNLANKSNYLNKEPNNPFDFLKNISTNLILLISIVIICFWNYATYIENSNTWKLLPRQFYNIALLFKLEQKWNMFSPGPPHSSEWYKVIGKTNSGRDVDVLNNSIEISQDINIADTFIDYRWQKYLLNLSAQSNEKFRFYYSQYLCRQWQIDHSDPKLALSTLKINYFQEQTALQGEQKNKTTETMIYSYKCN